MSGPVTENTTVPELAMLLEARGLALIFLGVRPASAPKITAQVRWHSQPRGAASTFQGTDALVHAAINKAIALAETA